MGKKPQSLSQAEIWDDSALIRSWDDALEEYKLYHSIHARGERVEDVVKAELTAGEPMSGHESAHEVPMQPNGFNQEELEDGELEDDVEVAMTSGPTYLGAAINSVPPKESHIPMEAADTGTAGSAQGLPSIPQSLIASQDEALKSLMMSWYWAGYYTGHYEGQLQAAKIATQGVSTEDLQK